MEIKLSQEYIDVTVDGIKRAHIGQISSASSGKLSQVSQLGWV